MNTDLIEWAARQIRLIEHECSHALELERAAAQHRDAASKLAREVSSKLTEEEYAAALTLNRRKKLNTKGD